MATGTLLITGIVGALAFAVIEHPALTSTASLAAIPPHSARLPLGGVIEIATAAMSVGIAIALYPVLRTRSHALALGAVTFRTIEATMYIVGALITLSLPAIAGQYAQTTALDHNAIQATADTLVGIRNAAILAGVLAYITGISMYYTVLYRHRLVPRWLSGWGIAAEVPMFTACMLAAFHHTLVSTYTLLAAPIFANELALAAWLLIKGFSPGAADAQAH